MSGQVDEWMRRFPSAVNGLLEKRFDIREKRGNFVYRHGIEYVFWVVLKITHFLPIRQETMSFFYAIIIGYLYLRNLNCLF